MKSAVTELDAEEVTMVTITLEGHYLYVALFLLALAGMIASAAKDRR